MGLLYVVEIILLIILVAYLMIAEGLQIKSKREKWFVLCGVAFVSIILIIEFH